MSFCFFNILGAYKTMIIYRITKIQICSFDKIYVVLWTAWINMVTGSDRRDHIRVTFDARMWWSPSERRDGMRNAMPYYRYDNTYHNNVLGRNSTINVNNGSKMQRCKVSELSKRVVRSHFLKIDYMGIMGKSVTYFPQAHYHSGIAMDVKISQQQYDVI